MIAALIHPDGRLAILRGELTTDMASIAALAHAVHAAGHELAVRLGTDTQSVSLNGSSHSLTLLPTVKGVLLLEHDRHESLASLQAQAAQLMAQDLPPPPASPPTAPMSLADALYATAP